MQTGSPCRPRAGSLVNYRTLTAAMIDSRDFIAARRRAGTELMMPAGRPKIGLAGGLEFNDHQLSGTSSTRSMPCTRTWCCCMRVRRRGAELIAAKWVTQRKVPQIAFKPD